MPHPRLIPLIAGPTAGGKSALAVDLALALANRGTPAEIVTADAFQIYKGMDIGTATPTLAERKNIPHHLIDLRDPRDPTPFTVHDWLRAAKEAITDIRARGKQPIVVGGTHLYVKALLDGLFEGPGADAALREQLRAKGLPALREELERIDPDAARRIHANDERRTIRALEVFHLTGKPISAHQTQWSAGAPSPREGVGGGGGGGGQPLPGAPSPTSPQSSPSDIPHPTSDIPFRLIVLDWPTELINPRINARVKNMMSGGLLEEVRALHATGAFAPAANAQAREALGYKQLLAHLEGRMSLEDAIERIKIDTRHFAKTQRTWLKRLRATPGCLPIDAAATPVDHWVASILQ
ncbi:MAG: tRNA (adenosine(37)-N6)-dimethylallyltransferase MiaA [Planctomycetes bacterium]|nr:tRNA (adenosine(37)-N6)-dimethylallyltransferase MiaA [Planctomycetota bacterium]